MNHHPNWMLAERILAEVLRGSTGFAPDGIAGIEPESWSDFPVDDREPAEVDSDLLHYCRPILLGQVVVVTDQSYRAHVGPFFVLAEHLERFMEAYSDIYDDAVVAGDTVLLSPAAGLAVVVHHNGLIATARGARFALQ